MRILGQRPVIAVTGIVFLLIGVALAGGGGWLAALGGSFAYLAIGLATLITGVLLIAGRTSAFTLFALVVLGTLGWALSEQGLDWWPMAARGDVIFVMGAWLVILALLWPGRRTRTAGPVALALVIAAAVGWWR